MNRPRTLSLLFLACGAVLAAVPNRIIYQGRLSKSGAAVHGEQAIKLSLVDPVNPTTVYDSNTFVVTLPVTGEFTVIWDNPGVDWRAVNPKLKVEVSGEALTPQSDFSASPYSFVAQRVEAGGVDTLALADGAVTDAKVATISAGKIVLPGTANLDLATAWQSKTNPAKIDASVIAGTVPVDTSQIAGGAVVSTITASGFHQTIQPISVVETLRLKATRDATDPLQPVLSLYPGTAGATPTAQFLAGGTSLIGNKLSVGSMSAPLATLDLSGSPSEVLLRNTAGTANQRAWRLTVPVDGSLKIEAVQDNNSGPITALTGGRDGAVAMSTISASSLIVAGKISGGFLAAPYPTMIVADEKPSGTLGGTFTGGSWVVRTLNVVSTNTIVGASLSYDAVTLPAGTYHIWWRAPAYRVYRHQTVWYNVTDSSFVLAGSSAYADISFNVLNDSVGNGLFTIPTSKTFQIWHRCDVTHSPEGLGV